MGRLHVVNKTAEAGIEKIVYSPNVGTRVDAYLRNPHRKADSSTEYEVWAIFTYQPEWQDGSSHDEYPIPSIIPSSGLVSSRLASHRLASAVTTHIQTYLTDNSRRVRYLCTMQATSFRIRYLGSLV